MTAFVANALYFKKLLRFYFKMRVSSSEEEMMITLPHVAEEEKENKCVKKAWVHVIDWKRALEGVFNILLYI